MKTIVSYITGRKDFPVYQDMTEGDILNYLQETDWADAEVTVTEEGDIEVVGTDFTDTFRIIDVEVVNPKPKKDTYRVYAEVSTRCYLDVEADSEDEALEIGKDADGGDFISEEEGGDWRVYQADKIS